MADGNTAAAVLTGTAAVLTAWAAVRRAKSKGNEECEENLAVARHESERVNAELHQMIMRHPEEYKEPEPKPEEVENEKKDGR